MDKRYLRTIEESDIEYGLRLIDIKKTENPEDLDWSDVVELIGLPIHKDSLRKSQDTIYGGYSVAKYYEEKIENMIKNENNVNKEIDEYIEKLEKTKLEVEKERKKLQATKIEYNRNLRVDSRFELLYENIKEAISTLEVPKFEYLYSGDKEKGYVLQFSDVHYGASFVSENNEYSREICKQRFNKMLSKVIDLIEKEKINKLHIVNNSDSLQGLLRISDVRMNDIPIVEATIEFSQMMASWLNELSKYVEITYYHTPSANHAELRLLNSGAGQMANEDLEKIIVNYIHDMLVNNPRVEVPVIMNKPYVNFNLCGYDFIGLHGHQIRSIENSLRDLSMLHKKFYSFVLLGHFHNNKEIGVGEGFTGNAEVIVSPSIVGSCPYSDKLMVGGKSMAKLHTFAVGEGRVQTNNILLN